MSMPSTSMNGVSNTSRILPAPHASTSSAVAPVAQHDRQQQQQQRAITDAEVDGFREQDRYLPLANVGRIMRESLPPSIKLSKEAKERMQECVSEFIAFVTSEMADCGASPLPDVEASAANVEGTGSTTATPAVRKTLNGDDLLDALQKLGFDNYAQVLRVHLAKYRTHQQEHGRKHKKRRVDVDAGDRQITPTGSAMPSSRGANVFEDERDGEHDDDDDEDDEEDDYIARAGAGMGLTTTTDPLLDLADSPPFDSASFDLDPATLYGYSTEPQHGHY